MGPLENSTEHLYTLAVVDIVDIVVVHRELAVVSVVDIVVVDRDLG